MKDGAVWVILNPAAGNGDDGRTQRLQRYAAARGWTLQVPDDGNDVEALAEEACGAGASTLVVAGGDGTVNAAVQALARCYCPPRLGVVPCGTANDFARGQGLPATPDEALGIVTEAAQRPVDLLRIEPPGEVRFAINSVTGGLSVDIQSRLDRDTKARWGGMAYAKAVTALLIDAPVYRVRWEVDGARFEDEAVALIVLNGPRAGGQWLWRDADPADGRFDLLVVTATDVRSRAELLARYLVGAHDDTEGLNHRRGRRLVVDAEPAMPFLADGEPLGDSPLTVEVLHRPLRVAAGDALAEDPHGPRGRVRERDA